VPLAKTGAVRRRDGCSERPTGAGALRQSARGGAKVYLSLQPGESILLRCSTKRQSSGPKWTWWEARGEPVVLAGTWQVKFLGGGPEPPAPFQAQQLDSWTELGDTNAQRFAGTALYTLSFDAPKKRRSTGGWISAGCAKAAASGSMAKTLVY